MGQTISDKARVGRNVDLGENVLVEEGAVVGNNAFLGDNVIIRRGAIVGDNAVVGYRDIKPGQTLPPANPTEIGPGARVRTGSVIYTGSTIGRNSMVGHNAVIRENTIVGHDTYIGSLTAIEGDTRIGSYVGIHTQCHITKFCEVGDYTFIAPMFVGANDQAMTHRRAGHGTNLIGFTTESYVRIAVGVTALPGVRFGEGCIVGAGALVTRDVPPYKVVMGIPARVVRDAPADPVAE